MKSDRSAPRVRTHGETRETPTIPLPVPRPRRVMTSALHTSVPVVWLKSGHVGITIPREGPRGAEHILLLDVERTRRLHADLGEALAILEGR